LFISNFHQKCFFFAQKSTKKIFSNLKTPYNYLIKGDEHGQPTAVERPLTVAELRRFAHSQWDPAEEERLARERAVRVCAPFRSRTSSEMEILFRQRRHAFEDEAESYDNGREEMDDDKTPEKRVKGETAAKTPEKRVKNGSGDRGGGGGGTGSLLASFQRIMRQHEEVWFLLCLFRFWPLVGVILD
jgi:hypothetical protein